MKRVITEQMLDEYQDYLMEEEKSQATISKYLCDLRKLAAYIAGREVDKKLIREYKEKLLNEDHYKVMMPRLRHIKSRRRHFARKIST